MDRFINYFENRLSIVRKRIREYKVKVSEVEEREKVIKNELHEMELYAEKENNPFVPNRKSRYLDYDRIEKCREEMEKVAEVKQKYLEKMNIDEKEEETILDLLKMIYIKENRENGKKMCIRDRRRSWRVQVILM